MTDTRRHALSRREALLGACATLLGRPGAAGLAGGAVTAHSSAVVGWDAYVNSEIGYSIQYPHDWFLLAPTPGVAEYTGRTELRRHPDEYQTGLLAIEGFPTATPQETRLTAELLVRSPLSAPWWTVGPHTGTIGFAGTTAQFVEGEYAGPPFHVRWVKLLFLARELLVLQLTAIDSPIRTDARTLDAMLATFRYLQ